MNIRFTPVRVLILRYFSSALAISRAVKCPPTLNSTHVEWKGSCMSDSLSAAPAADASLSIPLGTVFPPAGTHIPISYSS